MDEIRPEDELTAAADELRGARPAPDRVAMDTVRARAEQALFGVTAPSRLGRYLVVERLAGGGMGIVYRGYDPDLHRKVALKVLHPRQHGDDRAQARMIAEARALAKLDHPNVVRIHDVLDIDGQVVLVMELIEGTTLADWERASPRPWRDIISMYLQAGRGLAAAHSVNILHRDFKPANVIIGDDGRVRVLDFGLARSAADAPDAPLPPSLPEIIPLGSLTATGEVVGTLGYTSPEQLAGSAATAASDQFSFCVSLHRALEGVPPFAGTDPASLLASIRAGTLQRSTTGAAPPAWLRALTSRGLRANPSDRFSSIEDLLLELARTRGWRRWRGPAVAGVIVASAGMLIALRPAPAAHGPTCDGGAAEIASVWNDVERVRLSSTLHAASPKGPAEDIERIVSGLDAYRDRWIELYRDACVAHRRGEQSDSMLDRRMACLVRRREDLREAISVLSQTTPTLARRAIDVVVRLPDLTPCADVALLEAESEPPPNEIVRKRVEKLRAALARAAALDRAGRSDEALELATRTLADAEQTEYAPIIAEVGLLRGRILLTRREFQHAIPQLADVRALSLSGRLLATAVEAGARQLFAEAMQQVTPGALQRDASLLLPLSESLDGDHFVKPLLLNNIGSSYMAAGDRAEAARFFELARQELVGRPQFDIELTCIFKNLAMVTDDEERREKHAFDAWDYLRHELGDHHLETIGALDLRARLTHDPARSLELITEVCQLYDDVYPSLFDQRAYCHHYRGFLLEVAGRLDEARLAYQAAADQWPRDSTSDWAILGAAEVERLEQDPNAPQTFALVAAKHRDANEWYLRLLRAHALLGLAQVEPSSVSRRTHLDAASEIYRAAAAISHDSDAHIRLNHSVRFRNVRPPERTRRP